ncbi:MAG: FliH/SctL family protein [Terriglobales bacterium]
MATVEPFVYEDREPHEQAAQALTPGIGEEEMCEREQRARREARQELEGGLGADLERRVALEHEAVLTALREFERERVIYFLHLEREVVQLVLGVVRKVLYREAQMDPLLLAAAVRVALDQLAAGTQVDLFVPVSKMVQWEDLLRREPVLSSPPRLRTDPSLEPVGCRLETAGGTTDLTLEAQLSEIERGFVDLLQRRTALEPLRAAAAAS